MTATAEPAPIVLITGGAGGLGGALSHRFAAAGYDTLVVDLNSAAADATARELVGQGYNAWGFGCDVTDRRAVEELRDRVEAERGIVDALVNLAGVSRNAPILKIEDADFDLVFRTHVVSTLNTMRAFLPSMKVRASGRVVNTSSVAAGGSPAGGSYGAAKSAIEGLTRTAALEMARHGITVNCVAPGLVSAGMFLETPEGYRNSFIERIPARRYAEPDEIAACYEFLASPQASYVTGQTLTVCGGLTLSALS